MELDATCASFLAHWQSLRNGAVMPTSEAFLERPSVRHAPYVFIVELDGDDLWIRLQGTRLVERTRRDITGSKLYEGLSPELRLRTAVNARSIVSHPCGYHARHHSILASGRQVPLWALYLPLAVRAGRPPRIAGLSIKLEDRAPDDASPTMKHETLEAEWLDIGAGIPAAPPLLTVG